MPHYPNDRYAGEFAEMVHSTICVRDHTMAPHPYMRPNDSHYQRKQKGRRGRTKSVDIDRPLQGLVPERGKLSLPVEAVNRIQFLVEPKFAPASTEIGSLSNLPRPFVDEGSSERDRKMKILQFLKDECPDDGMEDDQPDNDPSMPIPIPGCGELQSQSLSTTLSISSNKGFPALDVPAMPTLPLPNSGCEISSDFINVAATATEPRSPLSQLVQMKDQLPAIEEKSKVMEVCPIFVTPDSPSSFSSSGSSKDGDEERAGRKKLTRYNGVGPILLWQFLLQSLVHGRHGICWTNEDTYEFQFTHPEAIAKAWGECKPKGKVMTYDKMCRSLRGYYKDKLLKKVPHHRFVFQFLNDKVKSICKEMQKSSE